MATAVIRLCAELFDLPLGQEGQMNSSEPPSGTEYLKLKKWIYVGGCPAQLAILLV